MKVLLIQPQSRTTRGLVAPPLGLMSIAPLAQQKGFTIKIFDANYERNFERMFSTFQPEIVGVSTISGPMLLSALEFSRTCKKLSQNTLPVIWGGIHASCLPEQVLQESCVDYVVIGEGEFTFTELLESLRKKASPEALSSVPGIAFRNNDRIVVNPEKPLIDELDALPFPAWDLIDAKKYLQHETPVVTSRGCPSGCTFCYNQRFNKRRWRSMGANRVITYIKYLNSLYPIQRLKVYDDNAAVDKKRFLKILTAINQAPLYCEIRPDYITDDFVAQIKKYSRDPYIFIGVESGSQHMLDYLHKGLTIEHIKEAFRICNTYKIDTTASFMIGLPHERIEDAQQTIHFVSQLQPTRYTCCLYVPFPGSPLYETIIREGLFTPPQTTRAWGEIASAENAKINVSEIDSAFLETIYRQMNILSLIMFLRRGRIKPIILGIKNIIGFYVQKLNNQFRRKAQ